MFCSPCSTTLFTINTPTLTSPFAPLASLFFFCSERINLGRQWLFVVPSDETILFRTRCCFSCFYVSHGTHAEKKKGGSAGKRVGPWAWYRNGISCYSFFFPRPTALDMHAFLCFFCLHTLPLPSTLRLWHRFFDIKQTYLMPLSWNGKIAPRFSHVREDAIQKRDRLE